MCLKGDLNVSKGAYMFQYLYIILKCGLKASLKAHESDLNVNKETAYFSIQVTAYLYYFYLASSYFNNKKSFSCDICTK